MPISNILWSLIFLLGPLDRYINIPGTKVSWNALHIFIAIALIIIYLDYKYKDNLKIIKFDYLYFTILILMLTLIADRAHSSFQLIAMYITAIWSIPLLIKFIQFNRDYALTLLIASLSIHAIWGLVQFSVQTDFNLSSIGESALQIGQPGIATFTNIDGNKILRSYGPYPHPNILGGSLFIGLITIAYQKFRHKGFNSLFHISQEYIIELAAILTFSRTVWISGILLFFVSCQTPTKRVRKSIFILTVITIAPLFIMRVNDNSDKAIVERMRGATHALQIIKKIPLWYGVGPGKYANLLQPHLENNYIQYEPWNLVPVHNVPLLLLIEWGIIPTLIIFGSALALYARYFLKSWPYLLPIAPILIFDHYLVNQLAPLLYLITLILFLAEPYQKNASESVPAIIPRQSAQQSSSL